MHLNAKNNELYFFFFNILPFLENKTVTFKPHDRRTSYPEYIKKKKKVCSETIYSKNSVWISL